MIKSSGWIDVAVREMPSHSVSPFTVGQILVASLAA